MDKYQKVFDKFSQAPKDEEVTKKVNEILEKHFKENNTPEVIKSIYSYLDLTSLSPIDSKESIWKLVEKINTFEETHPHLKNVAAICIYPNFTATVKESLTEEITKIAVVSGGFPSSQTFTEIKIAETALAISDGAEEIDIVINLGMFFEQEYAEMCEEIEEIRDVCKDVTLKVILETGILKTAQNIKNAAILSMYSGADFIKTSTGKNGVGASFEAVYVMCEAIREYHVLHNKKIGVKVAGGIKTTEDAIKYYTIIKSILGKEWLCPELFRIGASDLADDLLKSI